MLPDKGLYLDCNEINQPKGTWRDAKNILTNKKKAAITSNEGTNITADNFPFSLAKPIGTTVFPDGSYVVYSDGINGGKDRIGIVETDNNYTDLIVSNLLGFSANFPIRSSAIDYNFLGERIISFTDKNNITRILNIDNIPFPLDVNKDLVNSSDISRLDIFPSFITPNLTATVNNSGGNVKAGSYSFCIRYSNNDGTITKNTPPQSVVYVVEDTTTNAGKYDGTEPGLTTSKSITVSLSNLDTSYDNVELIVISSIKNIITAFIVRKEIISSSNLTITYLGTEVVTNLALEEILTPQPVYRTTGAMVSINNVLYHGNLEADEDIDYQSYANNIRILYNSKLMDVRSLNYSHKNNTALPGFGHGEVYAFYIVFILKNGSVSRAFHIPGRPIYDGESPNPTETINLVTGVENVKRYQVEDTTNKGGHSYTTDITDGSIRVTSVLDKTNMGYWENEFEVYPDNFPDLAGQKVRHHVFPSYKRCKDIHYPSDTEYMKSKLDVLGIDVTNVIIPSEIQSKISGYVITYAKKDYTNSINYGQDLLNLTARKNTGGDQNIRYDVFSNHRTNRPDSANNLVIQLDEFRSHIVDLLIDKPALSTNNLYICLEARYRQRALDITLGPNSSVPSRDRIGYVINYDSINATYNSNTGEGIPNKHINVTPYGNFFIPITELEYLAPGVISGNRDNVRSGESIALKPREFWFVPFDITALFGTFPIINFDSPTDSSPPSLAETTFLYTLKQVKSNVHSLYNQQILAMTHKLILPNVTESTKIYGGDRFIYNRSLMRVGATSTDLNTNPERTSRGLAIRNHIAEGRYNFGLRYEDPSNVDTYYYPKREADQFTRTLSDGRRTLIYDMGGNPQDMSIYFKDYNLLNTFIQPIIYEPSQTTTNKFPYRVIRSGVSGTNQTGLNSWKTYLSADFYEYNRNRGEIINLSNLDDVLLIHHRYGLFRTLGRNKLSFDTTEVFLGSGDIFGQEPKEVIPSRLGYLGTQNIFGCVTFKGGYAWWDQYTGRVFLLTGKGISEISSIGMLNYFRDNSLIDNTFPDNPINGQGLISVYDPKYNRLIFTKKSNSNPFTIGFNLDDNENYWIGWYDYIPDYCFSTNTDFYGFKDNKIHKFNNESNKAKYFEGSINPTSIDVIFNDYPQVDKLYYNINWITELFHNDVLDRDNTITHIEASTNYQTTGEVELIPHTSFGVKHNTRSIRNIWNFNKLRDNNNDVYKRKPLVGNYLKVKFKYDNHANLDSSQNLLYLYDLSANFRPTKP